MNLLSSLTAARGEGESVGIGRGPKVWRCLLARSSRVNEDSPAEPRQAREPEWG